MSDPPSSSVADVHPRVSRKRPAAMRLSTLATSDGAPSSSSSASATHMEEKRHRFDSGGSSSSFTQEAQESSDSQDAVEMRIPEAILSAPPADFAPIKSETSSSGASGTVTQAPAVRSEPIVDGVVNEINEKSKLDSHSPKKELKRALVKDRSDECLKNNAVYGDFRIVGAGRETRAVNEQTQEIFLCKVLTVAEYMQVINVVQRLQDAAKYYFDNDIDDMIDRVFPRNSQFIETTTGMRLLFTPGHYGSVHSFCHHKIDVMSEADVHLIFNQMVKIVSFCHSLGIIVREIKPRRLVFTDPNHKRLRLASVQELYLCPDINDDMLRTKWGSPAYVPPEVLSAGKPKYSGKQADVWCIGIVLYLLLVGKYPFFDNVPLQVFNKIKKAKVIFPQRSGLSRSARALVHGILRRDPDERPRANELHFFPWPEPCKRPIREMMKLPDIIARTPEMDDMLEAIQAMGTPQGRDRRTPQEIERDLQLQRFLLEQPHAPARRVVPAGARLTVTVNAANTRQSAELDWSPVTVRIPGNQDAQRIASEVIRSLQSRFPQERFERREVPLGNNAGVMHCIQRVPVTDHHQSTSQDQSPSVQEPRRVETVQIQENDSLTVVDPERASPAERTSSPVVDVQRDGVRLDDVIVPEGRVSPIDS